MQPTSSKDSSQAINHGGSESPPRTIDTSSATQEHVEADPAREARAEARRMQPDWGARFLYGFKAVGLGAGMVGCGLLAIGLFPFTIVGGALIAYGISAQYQDSDAADVVEGLAGSERKQAIAASAEKGRILTIVGAVVAAPLYGIYRCGNALENLGGGARKLRDVESHVTGWFGPALHKVIADSRFSRQPSSHDWNGWFERFGKSCGELSKNELIKLRRYVTSLEISPYVPEGLRAPFKNRLIEVVNHALDEKSR